eukprot:3934019-Rhodomonas_salina.1
MGCRVTRIFVLGPSHHYYLTGVALLPPALASETDTASADPERIADMRSGIRRRCDCAQVLLDPSRRPGSRPESQPGALHFKLSPKSC